jgi:hypothetical protein
MTGVDMECPLQFPLPEWSHECAAASAPPAIDHPERDDGEPTERSGNNEARTAPRGPGGLGRDPVAGRGPIAFEALHFGERPR